MNRCGTFRIGPDMRNRDRLEFISYQGNSAGIPALTNRRMSNTAAGEVYRQ